MKIICKILLITIACSPSIKAFSAVVDGLYVATVRVVDQSRAERQAGVAAALQQVLVKTTGSGSIGRRPDVSSILPRASDYMVEYAYLPSSTSDDNRLPLSVRFSKEAIDGLIRKLGLPIWPADRPDLLVWIVEQTNTGYRFFEADEQLPKHLEHDFALRGMPFQLPLYDLADQLALKPLAAWSLNAQQLSDASKRYGAEYWLVLRYSNVSGGSIRGSWYLSGHSGAFAGEGALLNTVQAESLAAYFSRSVDDSIDNFAKKMAYFADTDTDDELFRLIVENIGDFRAFSQLNDFLRGLEVVSNVNVRSIEGNTVVLDLATEGETKVLLSALQRESRLSPVIDLRSGNTSGEVSVSASSSAPTATRYRWEATR